MKRRILSFLLAALVMAQLLTGCNISNVFNPAAKAKEYSFIIVPDTQSMAQYNPLNFVKMTKWIVDNQAALNIKMVLHMGDVVNKGQNDESQYQKSKTALNMIDKANIPMLIVPGNHDYNNLLKIDRDLTLFNKYFGMDRYKDKSWFGGAFEEGKSENVYAKMEFEGKKYVFFALEFAPRDAVLSWVEKISAKYPDYEVVVSTHAYMDNHGGRTESAVNGVMEGMNGADGANDGEDMWQESFRKIKNLSAVYSGHRFDPNIAWQTDLGDNGNVVFQSIQDFQSMSDRAGRIRIVKYMPSENKVESKIFNTLTEQYETGEGYDVTYSTKKPSDPKQWTQVKYPSEKGANKSGLDKEEAK